MTPTRRTKAAPSFVKGRKGQISVVDCLVNALWKQGDSPWPESTFGELRASVSKLQNYPVAPATIRSSVYQHLDIFERAECAPVRWRLTTRARSGRVS